MRLHPVFGRRDEELEGRAGVQEGRRLGQLCLEHSARLLGTPHPPPLSGDSAAGARLRPFRSEFPRDPEGAPVPVDGLHWSTTNTHGLAAGVVAPVPIALDAEWLGRPRLDAVRPYFDPAELELVAGLDAPAELVVWTAKEVVLKLTGVGLAGLPRCRLTELSAPGTLTVEFEGQSHAVHSRFVHQHVLTIVSADASQRFELHELEEVPV